MVRLSLSGTVCTRKLWEKLMMEIGFIGYTAMYEYNGAYRTVLTITLWTRLPSLD
jgi:hypothetical protein